MCNSGCPAFGVRGHIKAPPVMTASIRSHRPIVRLEWTIANIRHAATEEILYELSPNTSDQFAACVRTAWFNQVSYRRVGVYCNINEASARQLTSAR